MVCLACHDSDEAKIHAKIMTYLPDPDDPARTDSRRNLRDLSR
jgi:hypothetical protein